jgi:hypothetical protein
MTQKPEKRRLTLAEAKARETRLRAAGITVGRPGTSTVTLFKGPNK